MPKILLKLSWPCAREEESNIAGSFARQVLAGPRSPHRFGHDKIKVKSIQKMFLNYVDTAAAIRISVRLGSYGQTASLHVHCNFDYVHVISEYNLYCINDFTNRYSRIPIRKLRQLELRMPASRKKPRVQSLYKTRHALKPMYVLHSSTKYIATWQMSLR